MNMQLIPAQFSGILSSVHFTNWLQQKEKHDFSHVPSICKNIAHTVRTLLSSFQLLLLVTF